MINSEITHYNEWCSTGDHNDDAYPNTKNSITFDCENLIIKAERPQGEGQICSILFTLTPRLIKELKSLISAIEVMELEQ